MIKQTNKYGEDYFKQNNIFGKLTVLSLEHKTYDKNGVRRQFCICQCQCGTTLRVEKIKLIRGQTKSCGCNRYPQKSNSKSWKGIGEIHKHYYNRLKFEAKKREYEFNLSMEYLWEMFLKQNRNCALTGIPLIFDSKCRAHDRTVSLDRIDNSKGYISGNVQWVHKDVNMMKHAYNEDYFKEICKKVTDFSITLLTSKQSDV